MSAKFLLIFFIVLFSSKCDTYDSILSFFKSFVQNHISNGAFLTVIDYIRHKNKHNFPDNYQNNTIAFKKHLPTITRNNGYIEDQSSYTDMLYGVKPVSYNGCGVIATYNVLYHLTHKTDIDFPSIIRELEYDGIILNGLFGTAMRAIEDYFKKLGYETMSSCKKADYDKIGKETDASVLVVYNNKEDITEAIHYMAITKKDGIYNVHNNGRNSASVAYNSISDVLNRINGGKSKDIFLVGIKNY